MPRNSRIPGVAEVPMPPAAPKPAPVSTPSTPATGETPKTKAARRPRGSAPKPVRLEPNFGKSGIRIFVGESKIPVATISQETLDEAFNDYGFAPTGLNECRALRDTLLDRVPKDFDPQIIGGVARIAFWAGDLEGRLAVALSDLKEARADHAAADVALQDTLKKLEKAEEKTAAAIRARDYHRDLQETAEGDAASYRRSAEEWKRNATQSQSGLAEARLQRDAAIADRNVWEKAAKEDRAQLVTLADELNRERQELRDIEKLRGEALLQRDATILGWRLATVAAVFVAIAIAIWKGVGR